MWENYRSLGYRRLIYTNTVSVLEVPTLIEAMGDVGDVTAVLLQAGRPTVAERLGRREHGDSLERHVERSAAMAARLGGSSGDDVHRLDTEGKTPREIAGRIVDLAGWGAASDDGLGPAN